MNNILTSYPMLNENIKEQLSYKIEINNIKYVIDNNYYDLSLNYNNENEGYIEDENGIWNPLEHNLCFEIIFSITNKNILFNEYFGIANKDALIGVALTWYCKSSYQIKTIPIGEIKFDDLENYQLNYNINFPKGELKEKITYKLILYLKDKGNASYFGQENGCLLGEFEEEIINLEGDGSVFPIEIIQDKNQLLWKTKFKYEDIREDAFNKEHICLYLNKAHKDFQSLNVDAEEISPLLKEILASFIYLFLCDLKESSVDLKELIETPIDSEENCIANIVSRWIYEFDIDLSSNLKMYESIRKSINNL